MQRLNQGGLGVLASMQLLLMESRCLSRMVGESEGCLGYEPQGLVDLGYTSGGVMLRASIGNVCKHCRQGHSNCWDYKRAGLNHN